MPVRRKLQVFVSSTFKDLEDERQAAVTAILNAGHIPAGMELFRAGDKTQWQVIRNWIDESDVLMLLLGGRYGSIEPTSGMSYIELEYQYAVDKGMPYFALVLTDSLLEKKKQSLVGVEFETNRPEYKAFRALVLSKMSAFCRHPEDVQIETMKALASYAGRDDLKGWVSGRDVSDYDHLVAQNAALDAENRVLKAGMENLRIRKDQYESGWTYEQLRAALSSTKIRFVQETGDVEEASLLRWFLSFQDRFAVGIDNEDTFDKDELEDFLFMRVGPQLMKLGLAIKVAINKGELDRIETSRDGFRFLRDHSERRVESGPEQGYES